MCNFHQQKSWMQVCRDCSQGSAWAKIGAPHYAFISRLNSSSTRRRAEARAGMKVRAWEISTVRSQELLLISWNFLSSVNSSLPEWEAKEAMSASGNRSGSARAIIIDQSFWSLFSRLIVDAFNRKKVNRRLEDSKNALRVPLLLVKTVRLSLFSTKGKKAPTKGLANTRSGHFDS